MEKKEDQLREAITKAEKTLYENECLKEYREGVINLAVNSAINYAKQYHSSNDSVEGLDRVDLRIKFRKWYVNNKDVMTACSSIFNWFAPHLQKQQESDAWINEYKKIKELCGDLDPIKVIELTKKHNAFELVMENIILQKETELFLEWYRSKQSVNTFNDCNNSYIISEFRKYMKNNK